MTTIVDQHRRRLVGAAALAFAGTKLGLTRSASGQSNSSSLSAIKPGTHTSFPQAFIQAMVDVPAS